MRLVLILIVGLSLASGSAVAQRPNKYVGNTLEQYKSACRYLKISEYYGHTFAECWGRPADYGELVSGRIAAVRSIEGIANIVEPDACGPSPSPECASQLRNRLAIEHSQRVSEVADIKRQQSDQNWRDAAEAFSRGFNSVPAPTPAAPRSQTTGNAPFCAVLGYGTQCYYYDLKSCQNAAAASGGACVARIR
jgi:hypothetical protein